EADGWNDVRGRRHADADWLQAGELDASLCVAHAGADADRVVTAGGGALVQQGHLRKWRAFAEHVLRVEVARAMDLDRFVDPAHGEPHSERSHRRLPRSERAPREHDV